MKNYIIVAVSLLFLQVQHADNMGFSLTYRPPLFNCAVGGCYTYKFSMSPVSKIQNASTKDKKVGRGEVLTEQHFIGYWAPVFPALYIFAPLNKEVNVYGNTYTALDVYVVGRYLHLTGNIFLPLINRKHSEDPNIGLNGSDDAGFAKYLYEHYFNTVHHDRTWPLFQPAANGITEISYAKLKAPVGTVAEYFNGTSSKDAQVLAYWPMHMIDPLEQTYPDQNDKDGFNFRKIREKITNYSDQYKDIGF